MFVWISWGNCNSYTSSLPYCLWVVGHDFRIVRSYVEPEGVEDLLKSWNRRLCGPKSHDLERKSPLSHMVTMVWKKCMELWGTREISTWSKDSNLYFSGWMLHLCFLLIICLRCLILVLLMLSLLSSLYISCVPVSTFWFLIKVLLHIKKWIKNPLLIHHTLTLCNVL